jgi:2-polyprenyl-3-methyl-5-hydroxy-6-metoxy-1,4-benzoquinol methylase
MPSSEYHEALWQAVPVGVEPAYLQRRLAFLIQHTQAGQRVLDVGCGEGRFTAELLQAGRDPVGVDVAEEPLARARAEHPDLQLDLRLLPASGEWPLEDSGFDAVWAGEVIEHVGDTASWLSEVRRVLRSGGSLLISTPAHELFTRLAFSASSRAFSTHFDPRSDHLRFYTAASLRELLADFGFHGIEVRGAGGMPGARPLLLAIARRSRF